MIDNKTDYLPLFEDAIRSIQKIVVLKKTDKKLKKQGKKHIKKAGRP